MELVDFRFVAQVVHRSESTEAAHWLSYTCKMTAHISFSKVNQKITMEMH
jgi:hypothetical protein